MNRLEYIAALLLQLNKNSGDAFEAIHSPGNGMVMGQSGRAERRVS